MFNLSNLPSHSQQIESLHGVSQSNSFSKEKNTSTKQESCCATTDITNTCCPKHPCSEVFKRFNSQLLHLAATNSTNSAQKCMQIRNLIFFHFLELDLSSELHLSRNLDHTLSSGSSVSPEVAYKCQGDNVSLLRCQTGYGSPLLCINMGIHWGYPPTRSAPDIHVHRWLYPPVTPLLCLLPFSGLICGLSKVITQKFQPLPCLSRSTGFFGCSYSQRQHTTPSGHPPQPSLLWNPPFLPGSPEREPQVLFPIPQANLRFLALLADAEPFLTGSISFLILTSGLGNPFRCIEVVVDTVGTSARLEGSFNCFFGPSPGSASIYIECPVPVSLF